MYLLKGIAPRDQLHALADGLGNAIGNVGRKVLESVVDYLAEPARGELLICRRLIDRHNSANFDGASSQGFSLLRRNLAIRSRVQQQLELWLDHFKPSTPKLALLNFSVERDRLSRLESVFEISSAKPQAMQSGATLA